MKYIDLFAGTGAFSYVLENKGFQCVFANDIMESSKEIYNKNHKSSPFILGDLNDINSTMISLGGGYTAAVFGVDDLIANTEFGISILNKQAGNLGKIIFG